MKNFYLEELTWLGNIRTIAFVFHQLFVRKQLKTILAWQQNGFLIGLALGFNLQDIQKTHFCEKFI